MVTISSGYRVQLFREISSNGRAARTIRRRRIYREREKFSTMEKPLTGIVIHGIPRDRSRSIRISEVTEHRRTGTKKRNDTVI